MPNGKELAEEKKQAKLDKEAIASEMAQAAIERLNKGELVEPLVAVGGEADISLNVRLVDKQGYSVQLTMRNGAKADAAWLAISEWVKLREKLETLGARAPGSVPTVANAMSTDATPTEWAQGAEPPEYWTCAIHKVPMRQRSNEKGFWYSHQLDDDSWCTGSAQQKKRVRAANK